LRKARIAVMAAVMAAVSPVSQAGFGYVPASERPASAVFREDPLALAQVAARLVPAGATLRWDRRVDAEQRVREVYTYWETLLFDRGLTWSRYGDEVHVRPAGMPAGEVELVTVGAGVADWRVSKDETLDAVLARWSARIGVAFVRLTDRSYRLDEPRSFRGTYAEAVSRLMTALSGADRAPAAALEGDGKTLVVRHRAAGPSGLPLKPEEG